MGISHGRGGNCRHLHTVHGGGKFSTGLRISVCDVTPTRLKVKCRINKPITVEVESTVEDPAQMKPL